MQSGSSSFIPNDSPFSRITDAFDFVLSLDIDYYGITYSASAVALSPNWLLTAAHNLDLSDSGSVNAGIDVLAIYQGAESFNIDQYILHPDFTGFDNPYLNDDLALLHLENPLSSSIYFPSLYSGSVVGESVTLVGYGQSGSGDSGYSIAASLTDSRQGGNVIDSVGLDDETLSFNELFYYDFDPPTDVSANGSLGNDIETMIGPGDSGGAMFIESEGEYYLAGINTFYDGTGLFGDTAGGILVEPYSEWIYATTAIPQPSSCALIMALLLGLMSIRKYFK